MKHLLNECCVCVMLLIAFSNKGKFKECILSKLFAVSFGTKKKRYPNKRFDVEPRY